jgi:hypothetical protein
MIPTRSQRLAFASAVAGAVALYTMFAYHRAPPTFVPDVQQVLAGIEALLDGRNPYDAVGPGKRLNYPYGLLYPLPAVLTVAPIVWLPKLLARIVFAAGGAFALAYGLTKGGWSRTPALLSWPMLSNVQLCQWTPWLMAAALMPALGWIAACKPNVGIVTVVASRRPVMVVVLAMAYTFISVLVMPSWLWEWREAIATSGQHVIPLTLRPGGVLALLAALRWRRPEARTMLALALVPITSARNESLFLWLAPLTLRQSLILSISSHAAIWADRWTPDAWLRGNVGFDRPATFAVVFIYLPALWWILRLPNRSPREEAAHDREPPTLADRRIE